MKASKPPNKFVFINCPFDSSFRPLLSAITFSTLACGYKPHCALEEIDSGETRLLKIIRLIDLCDFGIHDISCTELSQNNLPRFNMPFELGLFLGCKHFGKSGNRLKKTLVLDREQYRYQQFLSDLAGHDPVAHQADPLAAICRVRDWLASNEAGRMVGSASIVAWFTRYCEDLSRICKECDWKTEELTFKDRVHTMNLWMQAWTRP